MAASSDLAHRAADSPDRPPPHPGLVDGPVYLDYNATTPVDPRVATAMAPHVTDWFGNPSSSHAYSDVPRRALAEARAQVAALIGALPPEIVFTSSGSEADALALRGVALAANNETGALQPKGTAALYVREGLNLEPLISGGGQESGLRAGTENVSLAVALGMAAQLAGQELAAGQADGTAALRDVLHRHLEAALPGRVHLNGPSKNRLPNTLNISIDGIRGHEALSACPEIAASTGSACHSGTHTPSPVLSAMGLRPERALGALRLSLGRWSTEPEISTAAAALIRVSRPGLREI